SQRVHRWRSEEDAILVGRNTAFNDNPRLNVRHWPGQNPVRVVLDRNLSLPETLHVFDRSQPTIIYNYKKKTEVPGSPERYDAFPPLAFSQIKTGDDELPQILADLHVRKIQSLLVEGGAQVLRSFIEAGLWDEIRRCQSPLRLDDVGESEGHNKGRKGVKAPMIAGTLIGSENVDGNLWMYYQN
uniref:RibD family protein n=1 Tax=Persicitalea sp. TaxID=3100273 RepID=UPI0035944161